MPGRKRISNPHDAFFRRVLSDPAVAAEFLRHYLPPAVSAALDLATVQLEETSFTDHKLRRHAADLLFRVGLMSGGEAYILVLLEHKSAPDERVALQVLRYAVLKWDRLSLPLPVILPVVVYHGATPWRIGSKLGSLFGKLYNDKIWRRYLPNFEYHLCDLSKFDDNELQGGEGLGAVLKLLKHVFRRDLKETLPEVILDTALALPEVKVAERLETMAIYLGEAGRVSEDAFEEALFKASNAGGTMETFLERLGRRLNPIAVEAATKEATKRGMEQGIEQGMQQALLQLTMALLKRKLGELDKGSMDKIQQLPIAGLKQLGMDLLDFQSRADLDDWLQRQAEPTEYKN